MRLKERIPVFLDNIDYVKLAKHWKIDHSLFDFTLNKNNGYYIELLEYWNENYDQRFGQVLINLNLVPDDLNIWNEEDLNLLLEMDCNPRDVVQWGVNYDKHMNKLPNTEWRLIKDLSTGHIFNILKLPNLPDYYIKWFNDELKLRK